MIFVSLAFATQVFSTQLQEVAHFTKSNVPRANFHATKGSLTLASPSTFLTRTDLQPFSVQSVRPFPTVEEPTEWQGHFSAVNFHKARDQKKLQTIETSLKKVIQSLPIEHTRALEELEIKNENNKSRGMANARKIIIHTGNIDSDTELMAVLVHELGHVVDIGKMNGHNRKPSVFKDGNFPIYTDDISLIFYQISWEDSYYRKKEATRKDFVSGYGMTDAFEDFSESYLFYRLHGEKFRYSMKYSPRLREKYDFLKTHVFNGQEFQKNKTVENFVPDVIWDTTLLDFSEKELVM